MRTLHQKVCSEIGDKYFSNTYNHLAVLVFYCKLQLIHDILTNGLVPPHPLHVDQQHFEETIRCGENVEQLQLVGAKML